MSRCYRRPTPRAGRDFLFTTFSNRQVSCIFALAATSVSTEALYPGGLHSVSLQQLSRESIDVRQSQGWILRMASGASGIRAGLFGRGLDFCGPPIFLGVIRETRGWSFVSISAAVSAYFLVRARPVALGMAYNSGSVGGIKFFPLWVVAISGLGFPLTAISIAVVMAATMWALAVRVFSCTPQMMGSGPEGAIEHQTQGQQRTVTALFLGTSVLCLGIARGLTFEVSVGQVK